MNAKKTTTREDVKRGEVCLAAPPPPTHCVLRVLIFEKEPNNTDTMTTSSKVFSVRNNGRSLRRFVNEGGIADNVIWIVFCKK